MLIGTGNECCEIAEIAEIFSVKTQNTRKTGKDRDGNIELEPKETELFSFPNPPRLLLPWLPSANNPLFLILPCVLCVAVGVSGGYHLMDTA